MRSYEAARNIYSFLGLCAWTVIVLGGIVGLFGAIAANGIAGGTSFLQILIGAAPGALVAMAGVYGLATVQMGRTSVDSAEYAQQSLEISRQQLQLSKDAFAQNKSLAASYAALQNGSPQAVHAGQGDAAEAAGATYSNPTSAPPASAPAAVVTNTTQVEPGQVIASVDGPSATDNEPKMLPHDDLMPADGLFAYKGTNVEIENQTAYVGRQIFTSVAAARKFIDGRAK